MNIYQKLYEFASSAGAFEGYVYSRQDVNPGELENWTDNLVAAYHNLPRDVVSEVQPFLDMTLGRALHSLIQIAGQDHKTVRNIRSILAEKKVRSMDDFNKRKWFEDRKDNNV